MARTEYVTGGKVEQNDGNKGKNQQQQHNKGKDKSRGPNLGKVGYLFTVMVRFYGHLLEEAFLAALLATPIYLIFWATGVTSYTISTDFPTLFTIALVLFLLQSSMFRR